LETFWLENAVILCLGYFSGDAVRMQNLSHAVMAQRFEAKDSLDDFPTPPWATRALFEHVIPSVPVEQLTCLEPACHKGHMSKVLLEYFASVTSSDIYDYGYGKTRDFLNHPYSADSFDWIVTNPPFRLAEDFIRKSLQVSKFGVAILARTVFLESVGRYERLFRDTPPTMFAQFTERVPMVKGRLDKSASTATGYGWMVWIKSGKRPSKSETKLVWIPKTRKILELDSDYDDPVFGKARRKSRNKL
jgi:hypothetical protein